MPQFRVRTTFELPERGLFVMAGSIVEGEIQVGMFVHVPFNSQLSMTARIRCIEFARHGGGEDVCLCFESVPEMAEIWRALNIGNETVEVTTHGSD
jgi:hypothetical protein